MYIGKLGKCVCFNYTLRKDTFTLRGWLFWYWWVSLKEIYEPMRGTYYIGVRVFGLSVQRIGR